jgi:DNA polymerase-3 subunit beta
MKFECSADQLLQAVSTAARFIERRPNLPVLGSILITAEGSQLTLRATNLECGVEIAVPAKISTPGIAAVPGNVLYGFLSNARSKSVSGAITKEVLTLQTDRARASVKTITHEDFPLLPKVSASTSFSVKAQDFVRAIRSVVFCASTSAVKPELQSVLVYAESGKLTTVATDSFRLAEKTVPMRSGGTVPNLLIPARNAAELMRIMEAANGEVEIYYNENQLSTHVEQVYYTSRLIDGTYPNYKQIIPKTFATEAVCLREDIASSLKSLSVFADKFAHVSLEVDPKQKAVTLTSRNPDVGEQTSTIKSTIRGEGMAMSFSARYLADSLQSISGDSVRLQANGPGKPMLIKDAADDSYLYLAMPMNR